MSNPFVDAIKETQANADRYFRVALAVCDFMEQAEACNFTDRHGHALEMNTAYQALKESVSG